MTSRRLRERQYKENIEPNASAIGGVVKEDRWLSVEEIAEYLGVKRDTIYRWIDRRSMPAHKIGRLWKFKKDEIDEWVRKGGASENSGEQDGIEQ